MIQEIKKNWRNSATEIPYWWRKICPESGHVPYIIGTMSKILVAVISFLFADVPPRETSQVANSEEERVFS